ncbi:unnamed protein product [Linum tenue]|uniref:Uncharacterized protein n=1 Tax=Linum tenue TaxID=586396 RepID=A0AAV0RS40_9ROSI|nr:unnamed protein product [Linum tenue]
MVPHGFTVIRFPLGNILSIRPLHYSYASSLPVL